jgi:sugar lactone lactonase YvrE
MRTAVRFLRDYPRSFAPLLILAACSVCVSAQGTHLWTQSHLEEFEKGTPQGVALGSDDLLRPAPGLKDVLTTPSTFVWSLAVDKAGNAYAATGAPATVLRIGPDGKPFTLFQSRDVSVQALRLGPDGALYAATIPSGKVYRLNPAATAKQDDTTATLVFDPARVEHGGATGKTAVDPAAGEKADGRSHYVWDLTFDPQGRLYIATGGPAIVYRVDPKTPGSAPEAFFKSDEQHIRCLAWDAKGNLLAGTDGSGLVYRIGPDGKGYVLYEAARREIPALAVAANGTIYVASVGDKSHNPLPPLPVQGTGVVTFTMVQPGSLQSANASASVPEGTEIYALAPNQAPRKLWSGKDEVVYALRAQHDGLLALTGNRGRIFRIQDDGTYADIGHLEAQQGLALAADPARSGLLLIGTGNTGKLVAFGAEETHEFASDVLDAGALARFGRVEVQPDSKDYELLTRSGNVEQPVRGWSDWQPLNDGQIASPPGRFLQWKAVLQPGGVLGGVGVNFLPVNAAPVVDEVVVVPGARLNPQTPLNQPQTINISLPSSGQGATVTFDGSSSSISAVKDRTAVTARWAAHDDNGDDLKYALYLRGDGEHVWRLLKDDLTDKAYSFDETLLPDGGYELKVVASDAPSHTPGDALTGEKVSDRFEIDTTPPAVSGLQASEQAGRVHVKFEAEDAMSTVVKAEYSLDAGPWQYIEPVGKLSDARREHYDFELPAKALEGKPGEHLWTARAYDRHDNIGLAKTIFHTTEK